MLISPLDVQPASLIVLHLTFASTLSVTVVVVVRIRAHWLAVVSDLVAARVVVLGVEQASIGSHVVGDLIQFIIGASG